MHVVLLESVHNSALSQMHEFYKLYPKSCRAYVPKKVKVEQLDRYSQPPLMSGGWLLLCSDWINKQAMCKLKELPETNLIVYRVKSNKQSNALQLQLQNLGIEYSFIDNLNLREEDVINWILSQLIIDRETAKYLYDRYNGYLPNISVAVQILSVQGTVTKAKIRKYTEKHNDVPLYVLPNHLLGVEVDYEHAVKVVSQYRFAAAYLLDYLESIFSNYFKIYQLIGDGKLSTQNLTEFQMSTDLKFIKSMQKYHLQKVIESYAIVSIDYLLLLLVQIEKLPRSVMGLYKLVELCKLGGM